jgi:transcriptional regulator with PAS, ATPase and Fis domain
MIVGGPGTGKELFAKKIHSLSARKDGPFIVVNCGAYQESALESEIFGLEKGTLPNTPHARTGILEKADGGTILLDEVDQLGPVMQARIFRFLQEGEGVRMGGSVPYKVNVRMIACTNKDINDCVVKGKFREDLYYRINTLTITVPSLRDRKGDIPTLANHFLNSEYPVESHKILTPTAIKVLEQHCWPGNVRELKNVVERARILCDGKFIDEHCLPTSFQGPAEDQGPKSEIFREMTIDSLEKKHILDTLNHLGGNKTKTAKALGITVKTLYNKLHSYGLIQAREVEVE